MILPCFALVHGVQLAAPTAAINQQRAINTNLEILRGGTNNLIIASI